MKPNDGLPNQLCSKCKVRLKVAYEFRKQALQSHKDFENLLLKITTELESFSNTNPSKDDEDLNLLATQDSEVIVKHSEMETHQILKDDFTFQENDELLEDIDQGNCDADSESETVDTEILIPKPTDQNELFSPAYFEISPDEREDVEVLQGFIEHDKPDSIIIYQTETILNKKVFQCEHCKKEFSTKTNLVRHELIHTGSKKFQCKICGSCFTQSGSLKQHMYIHTGERPFVCNECGRSFTQAKSLQFHLRRHTGEKPFSCEYCDITFRQRDGLKVSWIWFFTISWTCFPFQRHVAVKHNKSYKDRSRNVCPHCRRKYTNRSRLQLHVQRHLEKGELFKCSLELCDELFLSENDLHLHEFEHKSSQDSDVLEAIIIWEEDLF